ncbi:hypothetical protein [Mucilaginibacter ginsenosidivorans]|uniref:SMI1/KNR4 family protein n=1 Tax=Mucilaginibacter ginsenosidivorans TaxID=398053 RepID=A0A5B8UUH1_9SPHI|nr:hypothetical protein [Mucilaginibacter ginsenosidivorans]QEC62538.1 hypothetical protein FRZ54_08025 [Mucilaginibacter ginsenosidivorans]
MKIKEYLQELIKIKPSDELLLMAGFDEIPDYITKGYKLDPKLNDYLSTNLTGLIFELFRNYDPQYISFGDFVFYEKIKNKNGGYIFAGSSYSELAFVDVTSEVIEYDRDEWSVLNRCAVNTDSFLLALLPLLELYSLRLQDIIEVDDYAKNMEYLNKCTFFAGGDSYKRFFKNLIF